MRVATFIDTISARFIDQCITYYDKTQPTIMINPLPTIITNNVLFVSLMSKPNIYIIKHRTITERTIY